MVKILFRAQILSLPLATLSDSSQALAVALLQVPRHPPAVNELHIAEFTFERFAFGGMVVLLVLQNSPLCCKSFLALVAKNCLASTFVGKHHKLRSATESLFP